MERYHSEVNAVSKSYRLPPTFTPEEIETIASFLGSSAANAAWLSRMVDLEAEMRKAKEMKRDDGVFADIGQEAIRAWLDSGRITLRTELEAEIRIYAAKHGMMSAEVVERAFEEFRKAHP